MSRKHIHSFSYFILLFEIKQTVVLLVFVQLQSALIGLIGLIGLLGITVNFPHAHNCRFQNDSASSVHMEKGSQIYYLSYYCFVLWCSFL